MATFTFYEGFPDDWERFGKMERREVSQFLNRLQAEYVNTQSQLEWERNGKYWAAALPGIGFRVIWVVVPRDSESGEDDIQILACELMRGDPRVRDPRKGWR